MNKRNKGQSTKKVLSSVWNNGDWKVVYGRLVPGRGRPTKTSHLFACVAEKLPLECLRKVENTLKSEFAKANKNKRGPKKKMRPIEGVYLAHDSMGHARYGGRGQIFSRLQSHRRKYPKELLYFSFYVIANKSHEREIETAVLRAAGPQMILNERKVQTDSAPGNVKDYEPGSRFFERQQPKGRKARK